MQTLENICKKNISANPIEFVPVPPADGELHTNWKYNGSQWGPSTVWLL